VHQVHVENTVEGGIVALQEKRRQLMCLYLGNISSKAVILLSIQLLRIVLFNFLVSFGDCLIRNIPFEIVSFRQHHTHSDREAERRVKLDNAITRGKAEVKV